MERVREGEWYWYISINREGISVNSRIDTYCVLDNKNFESNIYFHTKEEAEAMANKLRAVLKGADVIEMPSEEESDKASDKSFETDDLWNQYDEVCESAYGDGWFGCFNWLKSKIMK